MQSNNDFGVTGAKHRRLILSDSSTTEGNREVGFGYTTNTPNLATAARPTSVTSARCS